MEFRIADTFTESLARLTGEQQKAVKTTAFDLQLNPAQPSMQLHKLEQARDARFWSVRVSRDLRMIVHRTDTSLLLCYVDHHDEAYRWAERRKLETHPKTGAAQFVEIRETVRDIVVPTYVEAAQPAQPKARLFEQVAEEALLSYGVPAEWLPDVRQADEDTLLQLADHLPSEAAEALLELATGGRLPTPKPATAVANPFAHVVDAWQLESWEAYRDVRRLGRKTRLPEPQCAVPWSIFARVRTKLQARGCVTNAGLFGRLTAHLADRTHLPFDFVVVDEAQDVSVAQLRFLASRT
jgi:mRNA-degrading endonuclease RelE of RelBE toxin-antitoxin system